MSEIARIAIAVGLAICFTACDGKVQPPKPAEDTAGRVESVDTSATELDTSPESIPVNETESEIESETEPETVAESVSDGSLEAVVDTSTEFGDFVFAP